MKKVPFVTLDKLQEITAQFPTPFHLYDEKGIRENAKAVKEAFAWNKGFKEFFAVKATPNPFLIQTGVDLHLYFNPQVVKRLHSAVG
jgi:diaminopimelate decarboxylase